MKSADREFDSYLLETFSRVHSQIRYSEDFTRKVMARVQRGARLRSWILGGAASSGSALAGRQLADLAGQIHIHNPLLARGVELFGADTLLGMGFALLAGMVALLLPRRGW